MPAPAPLTVKEVRNPIKRVRAERIIAAIQSSSSDVFTGAALPDAADYDPGTSIWLSDEKKPVYSDGTNWFTAAGIQTA